MSVKSFECAIARSQIGRYLAGDSLGEESMRQLESHISACSDCQRLIDCKKAELLGPLANAPTAEEALATSLAHSSIATQIGTSAIERELREVAVEARAVVGVQTAVAVGAGVGSPVAAAYGASDADSLPNASAPIPSSASLSAEAHSVASASVGLGPLPAKPKRSTNGGVFSNLPLPKLVRDVPDEEFESPAPAVGGKSNVAKVSAVPSAAKKPLGKAAVYGVALLFVLGGMAYMGDPTSLLGGKAAAAESTAKMKGKAAAANSTAEPKLAKATGVRRSALGIPITDAVDSATASTGKPEKTIVAKAAPKADPADLGPLEFDPTLDTTPSKGTKSAPKSAPAKAAAVSKRSVREVSAPPTSAPQASVAQTAVADEPIVSEPVESRPTIAEPARVKPAANRVTAPRKRSTERRTKRVRKAAAPTVSKSTGVIRVYDETGKPLN